MLFLVLTYLILALIFFGLWIWMLSLSDSACVSNTSLAKFFLCSLFMEGWLWIVGPILYLTFLSLAFSMATNFIHGVQTGRDPVEEVIIKSDRSMMVLIIRVGLAGIYILTIVGGAMLDKVGIEEILEQGYMVSTDLMRVPIFTAVALVSTLIYLIISLYLSFLEEEASIGGSVLKAVGMSITLVHLNPKRVFKETCPFLAGYGFLLLVRFLCLANPQLIIPGLATFLVEAFGLYPLLAIHKFFLWTDLSNKLSFYNEKRAAGYLEEGLKELYLA